MVNFELIHLPKYAAILYQTLFNETKTVKIMDRSNQWHLEFRWLGDLRMRAHQLIPSQIPNQKLANEAIETLRQKTDLIALVADSGHMVLVGHQPGINAINGKKIFRIFPYIVKEEKPLAKRTRTENLLAKAQRIFDLIATIATDKNNRLILPKTGLYAYVQEKLGKPGFDANAISASLDILEEMGCLRREGAQNV